MARRRVGRKILVVFLLALGLMVVATVAASAVAPTMKRLSGNGGSPDQGSGSPNLTGNGRFVVFNSDSALVVPDDTNSARDTFLYDRQTDTVERVSLSATGQEGDDRSDTGFASEDGRSVTFSSKATNLLPGGTAGISQVFLKDRETGDMQLLSVTPAGDPGNSISIPSGISADGRYVAFWSYATDLVDGDTNGYAEVFLRDLQAGTTERLAVSGSGAQSDKGVAESCSLTPDARFAAFGSGSTNLVSGDTNALSDIYLRDRQLGTTERVNVASGGAQATGGDSHRPRLSPNGRYVVFYSRATNLVPGDSNGFVDVFLRDRQAGTTERVSVTDAGAESNGESYDADVSADGRYVVFASDADNLVPGDTNGQSDIFLRDRQTGSTTRLSLADGGAQAEGNGSGNSQISNDGRYVCFDSGATNLVPGDTNGAWDVFLLDRGPAGPAVGFTDIASSPYKAAIEDLAGAGIISGYNLGDHWEFRLLNTLKRAQFAKMIVGSWAFPVTEQQGFAPFTDLGSDDPSDLYPHEFVGVAYQKGITKGTMATTFGPYVNITRAQLITMVVRSIRSENPEALGAPSADWPGELPASDPTHGANIRTAEFNGLLAGISLGDWSVWADATRGETAQILYNMRGL
jgi:Tol biopolymer transport system component